MKDSTFEELYGHLIREKANELYDHLTQEIVMKKKKAKIESTPNQHYQGMTLQPIEVMRQWMTKEQQVGFCLGNTLKYLGRFNMACAGKGGMSDLLKANQYLEWLIELEQE